MKGMLWAMGIIIVVNLCAWILSGGDELLFGRLKGILYSIAVGLLCGILFTKLKEK